jgi:hypothetical protein
MRVSIHLFDHTQVWTEVAADPVQHFFMQFVRHGAAEGCARRRSPISSSFHIGELTQRILGANVLECLTGFNCPLSLSSSSLSAQDSRRQLVRTLKSSPGGFKNRSFYGTWLQLNALTSCWTRDLMANEVTLVLRRCDRIGVHCLLS